MLVDIQQICKAVLFFNKQGVTHFEMHPSHNSVLLVSESPRIVITLYGDGRQATFSTRAEGKLDAAQK